MNKINYSILLLLVCMNIFNKSAYGQLTDSYVEGSVELQNGETIKGYIKDDEMSKMNFRLSFKEAESGKKATTYDTSQVRSFKLADGEIFELIHFRGHFMTSEMAAFGKLLIKGKASLYKILYKTDVIYIIKNDGKTFVLQNDKMDKSQMSTDLTKYRFIEYLYKAFDGPAISKDKIENISFHEKEFFRMVNEYNQYYNSESEIIAFRKKPIHFIVVTAGGMIRSSVRKEIYFQGYYRTYFPKISRSTSLNIGLNYFNYKNQIRKGQWPWNQVINKTYSLATVPFQLQQNFLNKKIRPYAFAGVNASYLTITDESGNSFIEKGLQNSFGVALLYGAGIEADFYKGMMLKAEYRDENFAHLILLGIGYNFSVRK